MSNWNQSPNPDTELPQNLQVSPSRQKNPPPQDTVL